MHYIGYGYEMTREWTQRGLNYPAHLKDFLVTGNEEKRKTGSLRIPNNYLTRR